MHLSPLEWFGVALGVVPILSLFLFWGLGNFFGKASYSEPERLKREIRAAHGEPPESEEERARDLAGWFGWIPGGKKAAENWMPITAVLIVGAIVFLIWHVTILAFLGGMFTGVIFSWFTPLMIILLTGFVLMHLGGYTKAKKLFGAAMIICVGLLFLQLHYDAPLSKQSWSFSTSTPTCPDYTPNEVRGCGMTMDWAKISADRPNAAGYHFCFVHPKGTYIDQRPAGPNTWEYRAEFLPDGKPVPMSYRMKPGRDASDCPTDDPQLLNW